MKQTTCGACKGLGYSDFEKECAACKGTGFVDMTEADSARIEQMMKENGIQVVKDEK
jgi:DnaJ-class molecular chaperone